MSFEDSIAHDEGRALVYYRVTPNAQKAFELVAIWARREVLRAEFRNTPQHTGITDILRSEDAIEQALDSTTEYMAGDWLNSFFNEGTTPFPTMQEAVHIFQRMSDIVLVTRSAEQMKHRLPSRIVELREDIEAWSLSGANLLSTAKSSILANFQACEPNLEDRCRDLGEYMIWLDHLLKAIPNTRIEC
jgi:hypothetical protein